MCCWQEDVEGEAKGEGQEEARPAKNHVLDHRGLVGPCQALSGRMDMALPHTKEFTARGGGHKASKLRTA